MSQTLARRPGGKLRRAANLCLNAFPLVGLMARRVYFGVVAHGFDGSADYWEKRYRKGRDSGSGSYGGLALFKADVLNGFVRDNAVETVIELGCGDGAQLGLVEYPHYHGIDVSPAAIARCRERFAGDPRKTFDIAPPAAQYDLALSLDVIYHLVEDTVFDAYMRALFRAARRHVIVYSSNRERTVPEPHIRHRKFTDWVAAHAPEWGLRRTIANK